MTDPTSPADASAALADLAERTWQRTLELNPTLATILGDERYDDRLDDIGPAGRAARRALAEEARAGARAIDPAGLDEEERISRDLLVLLADEEIREDDLRADLVSLVEQQGHQALLPEIVQLQKTDTPERFERLLARIAAYPALADAAIELLAEGRGRGLTPALVVAERVVGQLERLLARPAEASPIVTVPAVAREEDRARLADAVERHVRPADARYLEALRAYLPATREEPGLCFLPDGAARYAEKVRAYTSLDLPPEELHRIGLAELESIEGERRVIAAAAGFGDDTAAYRAALNADPAEIPPTPEALVARCQEDVERAFAAAPRWFSRIPRARCEVRRVEPLLEKDAPGAYYYGPAVDGSRPGIYTRGFWPQGTAYVEGWALYTERVADEAGLFRSEAERFGMLDSQALRAVRLVVDTGLHAFGWSRRKAFETMVAAGIHPTDASIETDRYIAWPGQALAYMTGRREIQRLRAERERREGDAFDIRRFHDDVLRHGKLPLRILAGAVLGPA